VLAAHAMRLDAAVSPALLADTVLAVAHSHRPENAESAVYFPTSDDHRRAGLWAGSTNTPRRWLDVNAR